MWVPWRADFWEIWFQGAVTAIKVLIERERMFSKVSSAVILHCEFCSELTYEKFYFRAQPLRWFKVMKNRQPDISIMGQGSPTAHSHYTARDAHGECVLQQQRPPSMSRPEPSSTRWKILESLFAFKVLLTQIAVEPTFENFWLPRCNTQSTAAASENSRNSRAL